MRLTVETNEGFTNSQRFRNEDSDCKYDYNYEEMFEFYIPVEEFIDSMLNGGKFNKEGKINTIASLFDKYRFSYTFETKTRFKSYEIHTPYEKIYKELRKSFRTGNIGKFNHFMNILVNRCQKKLNSRFK